MKTAVALALAASAAAMPAPRSGPTTFVGISARSGSPVHLLNVAANDLQIWLGKTTTTECPEQVVPNCPAGNETVFARSAGSNTLGLDTEVPGGQIVYVAADGLLKYTQAHSGNTGEGSSQSGFAINGTSLEFEQNGWYACPAQDGDGYAIYAASKSSGQGCLGFDFLAENYSGPSPAAWQYS